MRRYGHHIGAQLFWHNRHLAECLHAIYMHKRRRIFHLHDFPYFFNGHNRADFIIYVHNGNKNGFIINRICDFRCTDAAEFIRLKPYYLEALFFKLIRRLKHAFMLYSGNNYSVSLSPACRRRTEKRKVICLCCAACKKDFFLFAGKRICKRLPCGDYFFCGLNSGPVQT